MVSNKVFVIFVRYKMSDMKFFKRLFPHKALPERTMVPDEIIRHYPEPQKNLESIIQLVPSTCEVLYQHIWHSYIPKDWKFWAMDLNQDDAGLNYLVETVLMELGVPVDQEVFNSAYIMSVARDVLLGNRTAKNGFDLLSEAAKKRGFLVSRGEYDIERMANTLLGEYHDGKLGRLTLELPDERAVDA